MCNARCSNRCCSWPLWLFRFRWPVLAAFTPETLKLYGLGFPFMLAGLWSGFKLYGRIDDEIFRKVVLVSLLIAGLSLIGTALIAQVS